MTTKKSRAIALKLITKYGVKGKYEVIEKVRDEDGKYNEEIVATYDIIAYIDKPTIGDIQGSIATTTDVMLLVSGASLDILAVTKDRLTLGDKGFSIKVDKPVYINDNIVFHSIICKNR